MIMKRRRKKKTFKMRMLFHIFVKKPVFCDSILFHLLSEYPDDLVGNDVQHQNQLLLLSIGSKFDANNNKKKDHIRNK